MADASPTEFPANACPVCGLHKWTYTGKSRIDSDRIRYVWECRGADEEAARAKHEAEDKVAYTLTWVERERPGAPAY